MDWLLRIRQNVPSKAASWGTYTLTTTYIKDGVTTSSVQIGPFASGAVIEFNPIDGAIPLPITHTSPQGAATSTTPTIPATFPSSTTSTVVEATTPAKTVGPSTISQADPTPVSTWTSTPPNGTEIGISQSSNGLPGGATAGIAVGAIVVGAAIGFLLAFCLLRRRYARKPQPEYVAMQAAQHQPHVDDYDGSYVAAKAAGSPSPVSPTPTAATLANPGDALHLSHFLLDAAPDKQLAAELTSLGHLIQQHVDDHYHSARLAPDIDVSSLAVALVETGAFDITSASAPAQLAADPRTRKAALQHVIAKVVMGSIVVGTIGQDGLGGRGLSMLPRSVGMFIAEMKPTERFRGSPEAMSLAFTRWRQLSAFLLSPERSDRRPLRPSGSDVSRQAREVVQALNGFLNPFVTDTDHSSSSSSTAGGSGKRRARGQEGHLEEVVMECTKFGYTLFSQPGEFRLRFETGRNWNEIVVCPGLEKVSDDQGVRYRSARTLMGPVTDGI